MSFVPKKTANKESAVYKSLYLKEKVANELERIAQEHNTSFNNVIVSMIEKCLEDND